MNRAISDALKARMASLTFSPAIPIGWPNRDFTPPADGRFMVFSIVRAENERLSIGSVTRFSGSVVVNIATTSNAGSGEGDSLADAVANHFPVNLVLPITGGKVRVTRRPTVREGYEDAGKWRTPVIIPFEAVAS
jgi:hypothetical protein